MTPLYGQYWVFSDLAFWRDYLGSKSMDYLTFYPLVIKSIALAQLIEFVREIRFSSNSKVDGIAELQWALTEWDLGE